MIKNVIKHEEKGYKILSHTIRKKIEDLNETGQYKEALQYLNDMDNEQVRYQRLVCLYGLKELQQAKREGMKAKVLAGETYYDVVAIYVSIL